MDIDLMDDADEGFQKCQAGSAFNFYCGEMAETIVELAGSKMRLSVCPGCAGDLVENRGAIELECEDGMDGELHAVDHVHPEDRKAALTSAVVCIAAFVAGGIR